CVLQSQAPTHRNTLGRSVPKRADRLRTVLVHLLPVYRTESRASRNSGSSREISMVELSRQCAGEGRPDRHTTRAILGSFARTRSAPPLSTHILSSFCLHA